MSRLFLIRHGQASFLEENYDKLSVLGERQARLLGEYWAQQRVAVDHVYSGPRTRQMETAAIVAGICRKAGLPWPEVQVMQEFDEYDGEWVMESSLEGLAEKNSEIRKMQQAAAAAAAARQRDVERLLREARPQLRAGELGAARFERGFDALLGGVVGRSGRLFFFRSSWKNGRVRYRCDGQTGARQSGRRSVAVFSSGGPIGVTVQRALDLSPENTLKVAWMARNCSYSEFLFSGDRFTLSSFNALPHLNDSSLLTYR